MVEYINRDLKALRAVADKISGRVHADVLVSLLVSTGHYSNEENPREAAHQGIRSLTQSGYLQDGIPSTDEKSYLLALNLPKLNTSK